MSKYDGFVKSLKITGLSMSPLIDPMCYKVDFGKFSLFRGSSNISFPK